MNTILEKVEELDNIMDKQYKDRMRLKCVETKIKTGEPFSVELERLIDEALRLKHEISELSAEEFRVRCEIDNITNYEG